MEIIEVINYSVTTTWYYYSNDTLVNANHTGFYHEYPKNVSDASIQVKGQIHNNKKNNTETVQVYVIFCGKENNSIATESTVLNDLHSGEYRDFMVYITLLETMFFNKVVKVKFEILPL